MSGTSRSRVWYWVGGCLGVTIALGIALFFGLWALILSIFGGTGPLDPVPSTQTGYTTHVRNGQVEFDLVYGRETTGIVRFTVTDADGTVLWALTGQGTNKPPKIVYGQVPAGWKQETPDGSAPPPDIRGKRVKVRVDTRFQVILGPGVEVNEGEADVPKE